MNSSAETSSDYYTSALSWVDYSIIFIMVIVSSCTGIYFAIFGKEDVSLTQYLMGAKKMKSLPIGISLVACFIDSVILLAFPSEVYQYGANFLWMIVSIILAFFLATSLYLPVLYRLQLTSVFEYLEKRFDSRTRLFASFLYVLEYMLYLSLLMYITSLVLHAVSGINIDFIVITVCGICIFYTTIGGLKSIVWIDIFQMAVLCVSLPTFLILGTIKAGGPSAVWSKSKNGERLDILEFDVDPTKHDSFWSIVIGTTLPYLSTFGITQSSILKYSSVPTFSDCKRVAIIFVIGIIVIQILTVLQGLVIYALYSDCDPVSAALLEKYDELVPYYVVNITQGITGICGLFIASIVAAGLSSVSTMLNSLSAVIYKDFFSKLYTKHLSEKQICTVLKLIVFTSGLLCILLVFVIKNIGGLLEITLIITSLASSPKLGIFSLGLLIPKANSKGAFYGGIGGLIVCASFVLPAKYHLRQNLFSYPTKPMSIAGCKFNQTVFESNTSVYNVTNLTDPVELPNAFFRISFYYYPVIAFSATMIIGTVISYLSKKKDDLVDRKLLSQVCHFFMPKVSSEAQEELLM